MGIKYLSIKEAAKMVKLSEKALAKHRADGTGPQHIVRGSAKKIVYRETDIAAYLERRKAALAAA